MAEETISDRLKRVREAAGLSQAEWSIKVDIAKGTIKKIETGGNVPSGETLLKYAEQGFNPGWILTGHGSMYLAQASGAGVLRAGDELVQPFDRELLGRIVDSIARLHKEERISLPLIDLGRLSGEKYEEIASATNDRDERLTMVKLMIVQLRKELRATPVDEPRKDRA